MPAGRLVGVVLLLVSLVSCSNGSVDREPGRFRTGPAPPASAWPSAFGDAGHTSPAVTAGPRTSHVAWERRLEGAVVPGAVVGVDGSVLAASNGGVLHALDPATGQDRWTYDGGGGYGSDLSTSPTVLGDGTVLWPGPGDDLHALAPDGRLLWKEHLDAFVLSPAAVGSRVYVADAGGGLRALDVGPTGQHRTAWTLDLGGTSYSSPAVAPDGTVYVAHDRELVAVRDDGGAARIAWRFRARDTIEVSPAVADDGTVVLGTNADDQYGLRPDGTVRWRFDRGDWTYSSAVVRDGTTWFGDHLGYLDALDLRTGQPRFRAIGTPRSQGTTSSGTGVWTAPLVDRDGGAYVGTAHGHVYGFGPDGSRLWDADVGGIVASYPALTADGTLLIGSTNGFLYAFGPGRPARDAATRPGAPQVRRTPPASPAR